MCVQNCRATSRHRAHRTNAIQICRDRTCKAYWLSEVEILLRVAEFTELRIMPNQWLILANA
jgi:hypothetical protein